MDKEIINLTVKNQKKIFSDRDIRDVEVLSKQVHKLSWIYKLRLNREEVVIAKVYKKPRFAQDKIKGQAQKEYQTLKLLEKKFSGQDEFFLPRSFGCLEEENIIFLVEIKGKKLSDMIKKSLRGMPSREKIERSEKIFFKVGRWLKFFQDKTAKDEILEFNIDEFKDKLNKKYLMCQELNLRPDTEVLIKKFLKSIDNGKISAKLKVVGKHGDFTVSNVYVDKEKVCVLDFSDFGYEFMYDDLCIFLITLEGYRNNLVIPNKIIRRLHDFFLQGYGNDITTSNLFNIFMFSNILEVLSWAREIVVNHAYHKWQKRCYIKFYENYLRKFCLLAVEQ